MKFVNERWVMFVCEAEFFSHKKKHGKKEAVEYVADINRYTKLEIPSAVQKAKLPKPSLEWARTLFDYNEHFIEVSNMGEEGRSGLAILALLFLCATLASTYGAILITVSFSIDIWSFVPWIAPMVGIGLLAALWPGLGAPAFFTSLRARYRFNRTTRKVYVLRPKRYGGNVILDWDRVKAHTSWCASREMTPDQIDDKFARQRRQEDGGGPSSIRGLVLYWSPLDPNDPERNGEEVLWVGPKLAGEGLWQYIRTFMEDGMDKVPAPTEYEWLRKGFHSPGQHLEETEMSASRVLDRVGGRGENSTQTKITFLMTFLWAPLHSLAERLCTWPTFPEEWNSDCGQKRREDGIGPEEPLRWEPSLENTMVEQRKRANVAV
ncbi:conserved hypothethical protein (plasmid) [Ralstonia solanacearum CMR15]|nr:conserved hypothethical protein [Ralstonia solanacearum CMR15]